MTKLFKIPASRLICFGGAKASTMAVDSPINPEDVPGLGFGD